MMLITMGVANGRHRKEDQGQHHKDQALDGTNENFQKVERQGDQESDQEGHGSQHDLTGKDVAKETKAKGDNAGELTNQLEDTNEDVDALHKTVAARIPEFAKVPTT